MIHIDTRHIVNGDFAVDEAVGGYRTENDPLVRDVQVAITADIGEP